MNIPAWEKCRLDEIGVFRKGAGISKASVGSGNVACIRYGEIYTDFGPYMKKVYSRISQPIADQSVKLEYGDIVFAGSGETHEEIGKCTAYVLNEPVYAGGDTIIFHPSIKCNSMFLGYLLNTPIVNQQKAQMGQGDAIVHISAKSLGKIELFLPNYEEQTAIATALSDTDALIDSLEKLIAKKQAIKQGAMQELLTGKRRLKGFSGEWNSSSLDELCIKITDGSHFSPEEVADGYFMPSVKDMGYNDFDFSACKRISNSDYDLLVKNGCQPLANDVVISKDGSMLKYVFAIKKELPIVILSSIAIIRPKSNIIVSEYIVHYFRQEGFRRKTIEESKTGTGLPRIVLDNFKKINIHFPCVEEQQAIAQILTDMDDEISALQKKLDKVRRIKQGMVAELLTGRIRLI